MFKSITFSKSTKVELTKDVSMKNKYGIMRLIVLNDTASLKVRKLQNMRGKFILCNKLTNAYKNIYFII